jgi:hypothetical protein
VNIASETITIIQTTRVADRNDALSPARAAPEKGRAMQSTVKKIKDTSKRVNNSHEAPATISATNVTAAIEQIPKMPRNAPRCVQEGRKGRVMVALAILN